MDGRTDPVVAGAVPPSDKQELITVRDLRKSYGGVQAVDGVSLSIEEGEIFGIIGPNGAGKTTTVECISGLRAADSGLISVCGLSPRRDRDKVREFVGVQLQESALPPRLRVGEALRLFAALYQNPLNPIEVLESLGIGDIERKAFRQLSGGQKQRLSIALALVGNPKIAILDELTTGLDPEARRETWALIERARERGVTVILVTHFMDEAETLCDRLALIAAGRVGVLGTPEWIAAQEGGTKVRFRPSGHVDDQDLYAIPGVQSVQRKDRYLTLTGTGDLAAPVIQSLAGLGVEVSELEVRRPSLDDAFVRLTRASVTTPSERP